MDMSNLRYDSNIFHFATKFCQTTAGMSVYASIKKFIIILYILYIFNPVDYRIWGILQECVYQKSVKNVDELNRHQTETWLGIQQSVIDQAIDQWRIRLNAYASKPKERI